MRFWLKVLDGTGSNGNPTGSNGNPTGSWGPNGDMDLVICVGLCFTLPVVHYGTFCLNFLQHVIEYWRSQIYVKVPCHGAHKIIWQVLYLLSVGSWQLWYPKSLPFMWQVENENMTFNWRVHLISLAFVFFPFHLFFEKFKLRPNSFIRLTGARSKLFNGCSIIGVITDKLKGNACLCHDCASCRSCTITIKRTTQFYSSI
jgi:hypothetical protein